MNADKAIELLDERLTDLESFIDSSMTREAWLTEQLANESVNRQAFNDEYDGLLLARMALKAAFPTPIEDYCDIPF